MERASLALRNPLQCPTAWNVMGLRLLTPFLNSSFFSSSWCEAVSFELCSFNKSYASGLQAFKRDLPRAELQWAAWFRLCVSPVCLQRGCPRQEAALVFSIYSAPHLDVATSLALLPLICLCSSCSQCKWLVWTLNSACRAAVWNRSNNTERGCHPRVRSQGLGPASCGLDERQQLPMLLRSLPAVLSHHSEGDNYEASSHSWSHVKVLTGPCAKCFASAERTWRRVESCENPGGSNLISNTGA